MSFFNYFLKKRIMAFLFLVSLILPVFSQNMEESDILGQAETQTTFNNTTAILPAGAEEQRAVHNERSIPAEEIDALLGTRFLTYEQAIWLILRVADLQDIKSSEDAFKYAVSKKWLPDNTKPKDRARLDSVSVVIMKSFKLKGGIMYTFSKNPRYAYRELLYRNVINGRVDPRMRVSGEQLLYYIHNVLARQEGDL